LFYSRRIGLNQNRVVPIEVGGRVTGKAGQYSIGALNIQTDDTGRPTDPLTLRTPATNFTVLRVKRDILRRSSIGAIFTNRSVRTIGTGTNQAAGADVAFSFFQNVNLGGYYARTATTGVEGDDDSYQARFDYAPDRYGARVEYLKVGDNFNPEVGLVRRDDFRRSFAQLRYSPRPVSIDLVRKFTWEASLENIENGAGQTETRVWNGRFNTEFENSDQLTVELSNNEELLLEPFSVAGAIIPPGRYHFSDVQASYQFGQQRPASGTAAVQLGHYYDGTIAAFTVSGARLSITHQLSVEPSVSVNRVDRPLGDFTTKLVRARADYAFSPRMSASALIQYSSTDALLGSNVRYRWEYHPGSELFVVYTDERDTRGAGYPGLRNRAFVVKVNRLFRF
jgi:hypothetical protein